MIVMGRRCFTTNDDDIKECDAPESKKKLLQGVSLQGTYPIQRLEPIELLQ
jgi:hypothetical protein